MVHLEYANKERCKDFGKLELPIEFLPHKCLYCKDLDKCIVASSKRKKEIVNPSRR